MERLELIETGGYGSVYKKTKLDGSIVATKHLSLSKGCYFFTSLRELNTLRILLHPNIVKFHNINIKHKNNKKQNSIEGYSIEIEMDLWETDLQTFMTKNYQGLSLDGTLIIFTQLLSSMIHLHNNGIYHLDIKPANILLKNGYYKMCICDFGCGSYYPFDSAINIGTINCRPPENFIHLAKGSLLGKLKATAGSGNIYSAATDVFSCGVILLYLLTGKNLLYPESNFKILFPEKRLEQFIDAPQKYIESFLNPIRKELNRDYTEILSLILKMLAIHPDNRPSLKDISQNQLFRGYSDYLNVKGSLYIPLYTKVNDNLNVTSFHDVIRHAFAYFEETLCSYQIVKTVLDISIRFFILNKTFNDLDLVSCVRLAFIFFDDDEDLPLGMFDKKYNESTIDMRCLRITEVLRGYLVIRNPFDQCTNMDEFDSMFNAYLSVKGYFSWKPFSEVKKDLGLGLCLSLALEKENNCIPKTWLDITCKSKEIVKFLSK